MTTETEENAIASPAIIGGTVILKGTRIPAARGIPQMLYTYVMGQREKQRVR